MQQTQIFDPLVAFDLPKRTRTRAVATIIALGMAGLLIAFTIFSGDYRLPIYVIGGVAFLGLLGTAPYAWRHPAYLPFAAALVYLITMLSPLTDTLRAGVHYSCLALFALPLVPRLRQTGLLNKGGFRLYCGFFLWAGLTCLYSLAPVFSIARLTAAALGFAMALVAIMGVESDSDVHELIYHFYLACALFVGISLASFALPHSLVWQTPMDSLSPDQAAAIALQQPDALNQLVQGDIDRFRGLFGNPNAIGELMIATVASGLLCWPRLKRLQKSLCAMVLAAALAMAALADSRSALLAMMIGVALYVYWRYRALGLIGLCTALAAVGAVAIARGGLSEYVSRGLGTLTGRTDIWSYAIGRIAERPILGYGYQVSGAIFASRFFPIWYGPWDMGPHSSLHDGYIACAVGVGVPATLLWLFLTLRPWVSLFRASADPWNLKRIALLVVLPALVYNITEATLVDFYGLLAFLFGLCWALAEKYRLRALAADRAAEQATFESLPAAAQALQAAAWTRT